MVFATFIVLVIVILAIVISIVVIFTEISFTRVAAFSGILSRSISCGERRPTVVFV